jgi:hypothetical protein
MAIPDGPLTAIKVFTAGSATTEGGLMRVKVSTPAVQLHDPFAAAKWIAAQRAMSGSPTSWTAKPRMASHTGPRSSTHNTELAGAPSADEFFPTEFMLRTSTALPAAG